MSAPARGSVWEARYHVCGRSAVWNEMFVCELLTGPDRGKKVIIPESAFSGIPSSDGTPNRGLSLARRRKGEASS